MPRAQRAAAPNMPSRHGPRRWAGAESGRRDLNPRPPEPHTGEGIHLKRQLVGSSMASERRRRVPLREMSGFAGRNGTNNSTAFPDTELGEFSSQRSVPWHAKVHSPGTWKSGNVPKIGQSNGQRLLTDAVTLREGAHGVVIRRINRPACQILLEQ